MSLKNTANDQLFTTIVANASQHITNGRLEFFDNLGHRFFEVADFPDTPSGKHFQICLLNEEDRQKLHHTSFTYIGNNKEKYIVKSYVTSSGYIALDSDGPEGFKVIVTEGPTPRAK